MPRTYTYTVMSRDTDLAGVIRITSLCAYILEAAGEDANKRGFGVGALNTGNATWVLSRMAVHVDRCPREGEILMVTTWVSDILRAYTTRNMEVRNGDGNLVARCVTMWSVIDLDDRLPVDLRGLFIAEDHLEEIPSPIDRPRKVPAFQPDLVMQRPVCYGDVDFNGHMSSLRYMEWMLDIVPIQFHRKYFPGRVDINFLHEALCGKLLTVSGIDDGYGLFEINDGNGTALCRCAVEWMPR